jgi:hypothetical protein
MHIVLWARPVLEHQSHVAPPKAYRLGSLNGLKAANLTVWKHQRVVGMFCGIRRQADRETWGELLSQASLFWRA